MARDDSKSSQFSYTCSRCSLIKFWEIPKAYEKLNEMPNQMQYLLIKAPIDNDGTTIKPIKVAEFDIENS